MTPTTRETADHAELARLAEAATKGPWDRMKGRGLVRAIRGDLAVPLFEPLEPYSDPLLDAPTCRVGGEVVFRANSQAARESAAIRQAVHNAAFIVAANPATVLALLSEIAALRDYGRDVAKEALEYRRQRDELRKALEFYAQPIWSIRGEFPEASPYSEYRPDCGDTARQALTTQGADQ